MKRYALIVAVAVILSGCAPALADIDDFEAYQELGF